MNREQLSDPNVRAYENVALTEAVMNESGEQWEVKLKIPSLSQYPVLVFVPSDWVDPRRMAKNSNHSIVVRRGKLRQGKSGDHDYDYFWDCIGFDGNGESAPAMPADVSTGQARVQPYDDRVLGQVFGNLFTNAVQMHIRHSMPNDDPVLDITHYFHLLNGLRHELWDAFTQGSASQAEPATAPQEVSTPSGAYTFDDFLDWLRARKVKPSVIKEALYIPDGYFKNGVPTIDTVDKLYAYINLWRSIDAAHTLGKAHALVEEELGRR